MNNQSIQKADQAGHTKLTLVSMGHGNNRHVFFIPLLHDSRGRAILPHATLNKVLAGVPRGTTVTTG